MFARHVGLRHINGDIVIESFNRYRFDWVLGFGADHLEPTRLRSYVHKFVELVFLREAKVKGLLPALPAILSRPQENSHFLDSVERSMCDLELLAYTSVVVGCVYPGHDAPIFREMVFSSQLSMWGIPLPGCPQCGNHQVRAVQDRVRRKGKHTSFSVRCHGCTLRTDGPGVGCPEGIVSVAGTDPQDTRFFWKPLHLPSPWLGHKWRLKKAPHD
jgi:hypothetical protein